MAEAALRAWRAALPVLWEHLLEIVLLSLVWSLAVPTLILAGPATLGFFAVSNRWLEGEAGGLSASFGAFLAGGRAHLRQGLALSAGWVLLGAIGYSDMVFYRRVLPPALAGVVGALWFYLIVFLVMVQTFWLPLLTAGRYGFGKSLRLSIWLVLANPFYTLALLAAPLATLYLASRLPPLFVLLLPGVVVQFSTAALRWVPVRPKGLEL